MLVLVLVWLYGPPSVRHRYLLLHDLFCSLGKQEKKKERMKEPLVSNRSFLPALLGSIPTRGAYSIHVLLCTVLCPPTDSENKHNNNNASMNLSHPQPDVMMRLAQRNELRRRFRYFDLGKC